MNVIISAGSALTQMKVQSGVMTKMEGRFGVLQSEIKLDSSRGVNVDAKKEKLAEVQQKITQIEASQTRILDDINKEFESANKEEQTEKTNEKDKTSNKKINTKDETNESDKEDTSNNLVSKDNDNSVLYNSIDVHI